MMENSTPFTIAAAQIPSVRGDLSWNLQTHAAAISAAAAHGVSLLVGPELSLIGYEPELAQDLALSPDDPRLDLIAAQAQRHQMQVIVGAALASEGPKPQLGAILFMPDGSRRTYAKMHLGVHENKYFVPGQNLLALDCGKEVMALSICADSSQPSHPEECHNLGATVYACSVFLNEEWYASDIPRFAMYAARHRMLVVMANHAHSIGTLTSVGRSAIWSPEGKLLAQVQGSEPALVLARRHNDHWQADIIAL